MGFKLPGLTTLSVNFLFIFKNRYIFQKVSTVIEIFFLLLSHSNNLIRVCTTIEHDDESFPIKNIKCHGTAFRTQEVLLSIDPKYDG